MLSYKIEGLNETIADLNKKVSQLKRAKINSQSRAADFGLNEAKTRVPVDSGETRDNITKLDNEEDSIIISIPALSDLTAPNENTYPTDKPRAVNVLIDNADTSALGWDAPRSGEFGFMQNTVEPTRQEFIRLLNVEIQEVTA
jgi:hypothetical protein